MHQTTTLLTYTLDLVIDGPFICSIQANIMEAMLGNLLDSLKENILGNPRALSLGTPIRCL